MAHNLLSRHISEQQNALDVDQMRDLLSSVREMLAVLSPEGTFLYCSPQFESCLGYRPEDLLGTSVIQIIHEDCVAEARKVLRQLGNTPAGPLDKRFRLRAKNGDWKWFEASAKKPTGNQFSDGIVISLLDVTELDRMQSERRVISEIVHALNHTANLDQLLGQIHETLKRVLYAENFFIALHEESSDSFSFPFFVDQYDTAPAPQKVGRSCTAFVFRTGTAMLIPQSEFDGMVERGEVELVGSPSPAWLGVPLKTPTATIGVLVLQHYENQNAYDPRDLEFLDSVGGHIALAIERRRSEEALRRSEATFRLLFAHNPLPTWVFDIATMKFVQVNDSAVRQYGYTAEEFAKMTVLDIRPGSERESFLEFTKGWKKYERFQGTHKHQKKDGKIIEVEIISHSLEYGGREVRLVVARDITERQQLEQQLRQSQKMEAVGRLAGGVAHDFNNLLMVIKGHTELLLNQLPSGDNISRKIGQIDRAADRAAGLTRQLLAFSRMQVLQPKVMNLNAIVEDMGKLLPRLIGEHIQLVVHAAPDLGLIRADAGQMEQIIMNLAVNARDAMPNGGRLLIETSNAELDRAYNSSHPVVQPGRYVLLAVSDSGCGMDAVTQAHIFEPFFTTKEQGKGTGLGLSTVYGVVKQSGGFIWVYSELERGTCFKVYLPRTDELVASQEVASPTLAVPLGSETILLAEDEHAVREVAREFLESGGYRVIEARDGAHALELARNSDSPIDLLVTDMIMPGITGQQLAADMRADIPGLRVLYMSGYSEHANADANATHDSIQLLTKPFSRAAILRTVREVLNKTKLVQ